MRTRPRHRRRHLPGAAGWNRLGHGAGLLGLAALLAFAVAGPVSGAGSAREEAALWRATFEARPLAALRERVIVLLDAPSVAQQVTAAGRSTAAQERRWHRAALASQRELVRELRARGAEIERDLVFTRTVNGFSAVVDGRARAALERSRRVVGVYPVRSVYPASLSSATLERAAFAPSGGRRPELTLAGRNGSGVTIALLDTGVDATHPYLAGRLARGYDVVDGDGDPSPGVSPGDGSLERHGTRMAGLVVGSGGPAGLAGVAPGARLVPIRILGWQQASDGGWHVLGRGDQLLAGLERAVDPDGDGSVGDAARIALAPVVEPYAAFADSPEARAVTGALALGTLVVAPVGNDGPAEAGYGTIGAPASSSSALAVGAADVRTALERVRVTATIDGVPVLDQDAELLGAVSPPGPVELDVVSLGGAPDAAAGRPVGASAGAQIADYLDAQGASRVTARAVLLAEGAAPLPAIVRSAVAAGAALVVLAGTALPSGALDLDETTAVPVLQLPADAMAAVSASIAGGSTVRIALAPAPEAPNAGAQRVAPFSSRGLAFDGRLRPDVVAPGVAIATSDAGLAVDGTPRWATVTGSSAAAAAAAGAAALVSEARPDLDAAALRAVLVGGARPLAAASGYETSSAQGAGLVDPAGAAGIEVAIEPATLALGRLGRSRFAGELSLRARNLSDRAVVVSFGLVPDGDAARLLTFAADPARLELGPGDEHTVRLVISGEGGGARGWVSGTIVATPDGGPSTRVPWATALADARDGGLVTAATLSRQEFPATGGLGALLTFRAGWVGEGTDGIAVGAIGLLDVEVWRQDERLGVVARLRDLLPGRYAIGLTGRGPDGGPLAPGRYEIRFVTRPADGRDGSARTLGGPQFRVVEANAGRAAAGTALELRWGGLTYGAGGLDAFARWLGDRGASYERWRRSHSEVACDVFTDCR